MQLRPGIGGFLRPFGCGWFIREYLLGHGPEGSPMIGPDGGACQEDVFYHYKQALHRAWAEDAVAREEERRIKQGKTAYSPEEYQERRYWFLERIPSKLAKCRYHSFVVYFGMFKRLGWVEAIGEERSGPQDYDDRFQPRRFYRLTDKGRSATVTEVSDPLMTLYNYPRSIRSAKRHKYYIEARIRRI